MKTIRKPTFAKASAGKQNLLAVALIGALALPAGAQEVCLGRNNRSAVTSG